MKKSLLIVWVLIANTGLIHAQTLLNKVPANASMVIKYAGENFKTLMPIEKIDNFEFVKKNLYKIIGADTLTSLKNTGIAFEKDNYQYALATDSSLSFITLLNLQDAAQFAQFVKAAYGSKKQPIVQDNYTTITLSDNMYVGWSSTEAVIVNSTYLKKTSYYTHKYETTKADTSIVVDEKITEVIIAPQPKKKPTINKNGYKVPQKKGTKSKKTTPAKKTKPKPKVDTAIVAPYDYHVEDSIDDIKRELWEQQQNTIARVQQQSIAKGILNNTFLNTYTSIATAIDYNTIIEKNAHISLWINNSKLTALYQNYSFSSLYSLKEATNTIQKTDTAVGYNSALNIYFEKTKMRMVQKSFSRDEVLNKLTEQVMQSKQKSKFINYINPGNLGYLSVSVNTEAMINYYYSLLKEYLKNSNYVGEYTDMVSVYIDLLAIMIDEKGIANLTPGNYLFVLHNMQTKTVQYTDYSYDNEYNKKEEIKTKKELSPNFTYLMETNNEKFMERIARLPLKYAEKNGFVYKDRNGYYELVIDSSKYPISSLYFMVKDGAVMITTNFAALNMHINNTAFVVDEAAKQNIENNNYAMMLDAKNIFKTMQSQASTKANKLTCEYLKNNIDIVQSNSQYKDGMIQGTTSMSITGEHENSLAFFFNMLNSLIAIQDNETAEELIKKD